MQPGRVHLDPHMNRKSCVPLTLGLKALPGRGTARGGLAGDPCRWAWPVGAWGVAGKQQRPLAQHPRVLYICVGHQRPRGGKSTPFLRGQNGCKATGSPRSSAVGGRDKEQDQGWQRPGGQNTHTDPRHAWPLMGCSSMETEQERRQQSMWGGQAGHRDLWGPSRGLACAPHVPSLPASPQEAAPRLPPKPGCLWLLASEGAGAPTCSVLFTHFQQSSY